MAVGPNSAANGEPGKDTHRVGPTRDRYRAPLERIARSASVNNGSGNVRRVVIENEPAGEDDVLVDADVFVVQTVVDKHRVANAGGVDARLNCTFILRYANEAGARRLRIRAHAEEEAAGYEETNSCHHE